MKELQGVIAASKISSTAPPPLVKTTPGYILDISNFSPIPKIVSEIRTPRNADTVNKEYYVFTNKYDEIIAANELSEPTELTRLSKTMKKRATILSHLHKSAMDQFVGEIKTARAVMPSITILVDNSGSMRGDKSLNISAWLHIMSKLFQDCGLQSEILGFTTRAWKGGRSRELWVERRKPPNPGRLNDLRHIVYKDFASSHEAIATNFALMLREGILKENIDGEALLWAYSRLSTVKGANLLIVISDSAPVDDSTLIDNRVSFLHEHARATSQWLSQQKGLTLFGVGVGYDTTLYYRNGITIPEASGLGAALFKELPNLLLGKSTRR